MILLEKDKYHKVVEPLSKVKINNLFARSVVEEIVSGTIYVDNANNPKTFYVIHPYGISLLFGDCNNSDFNTHFKTYGLNTYKTRNRFEWMQAFPSEWNTVLNELFSDCIVLSSKNIGNKENGIIELNTRINFDFKLDKYLELKKSIKVEGLNIVRTDKQMYEEMSGSVVPKYFWDNATDFYTKAIGFSLFHENKLASTAYSAFIHDNKLEIGIETLDEFRGTGFAKKVCSSLIDYCLENNYEPIWSCKLENIGSVKLANSLGFEEKLRLPFYRLSN